MATYTFTKLAVDEALLTREIYAAVPGASGNFVGMENTHAVSDNLLINFASALSGGDLALLADAVAAHPVGVAVPEVSGDAVAGVFAAPGVHVSGGMQAWGSFAAPSAGNAFFQRVYLPAGTYDRCQVAVVNGASSGRTIDVGIYACSLGNPPRPIGSLLGSTGALNSAGYNGKFWTKPLGAVLELPAGYYWLAVVVSSNSLKLMTSLNTLASCWYDRLFVAKTDYGNSLGALPVSFDAAFASALLYVAILLRGADDMDGV